MRAKRGMGMKTEEWGGGEVGGRGGGMIVMARLDREYKSFKTD